jgi:hypothetical protein
MKNLRNFIARSTFTLAVTTVAFGLASTQASAAPIVFEVDEGAVTDADDVSIFPDGITGKYLENLVFTGATTWSATLVVNFTDYTLGGLPIESQVAPATGDVAPDENLYSYYALVTASGTFTQVGNNFFFEPDDSTARLYTDPNRDTTKDYTTLATANDADDQHILTATGLDESESLGAVFTNGSGGVLGGFYALVYHDITLILPDGPLYYPTFADLKISGTASGDVDPSSEGSEFPGGIQGDTSIAFTAPEPASMALFGLALLGSGLAARRRRTE